MRRHWNFPLLASSDLPWLWGTGSQTAEGDMGLRSATGGMLAKAASGVVDKCAREDDDDDARLQAADRLGRVRARLADISPDAKTHLWVHNAFPALPFLISAAAIFTAAAASLTGEDCPSRDTLRAKLRGMKGTDNRIRGLENETKRLVAKAEAEYDRGGPAAEAERETRSKKRQARESGRAAATAMHSDFSSRAALGDPIAEAGNPYDNLDAKLAAIDTVLARLRAA